MVSSHRLWCVVAAWHLLVVGYECRSNAVGVVRGVEEIERVVKHVTAWPRSTICGFWTHQHDL